MSNKAKKTNETMEKARHDIDAFCALHRLDYRFINESQVRVMEAVDFYPARRKYFVLASKKWGIYFKLEDLLKYFHAVS